MFHNVSFFKTDLVQNVELQKNGLVLESDFQTMLWDIEIQHGKTQVTWYRYEVKWAGEGRESFQVIFDPLPHRDFSWIGFSHHSSR